MKKTVYDFSADNSFGFDTPLSQYKGKVLLIVNTASKCGFTPQYEGLQKLYEDYRNRGFEILAFPCNQFLFQEPGDNEEIRNFCESNYSINFPLFAKIKVNGGNAHPLYRFLKKETPGALGSGTIKWNFTKFLVDREGHPIKRFAPATTPDAIRSDIEALLDEKQAVSA